MDKVKFLSVMITLAVVAGGMAHAEDWKVGDKWTYKHEGPRPFSDPSAQIKGDRTVEVTKIEGAGAAERYLLKTLWGTEDANPTITYIDPKNMIHKMDIQYMAVLNLNPPVPAIWSLKPGEQATLKTNMDVGGFLIPMEYVTTRLKDETLTVPAGTFEKCQHIQIICSLQNEMGEPVKVKTDQWYHPKVKNFVKEVSITNYQSDNSYTGTSILKSYISPTEKDNSEPKIGDPATRLNGLQWIKGGPVELTEGNIYVVEFWATWCPPCRVSIPHLTKLQKKFKSKKVTIVGISTENADKVEPFVKEKGNVMDYVVAIDPQRKISNGYMTAYKQQGIPTAFIVDQKLRVVWVGHPMSDLESVLEEVVAGTFDAEAYKLERNRDAKAKAAMREYFKLIENDAAKAKAAANTIIENGSGMLLNAFAWGILTKVEPAKQDLPVALEAAAKANTITKGKNAAILDTFALALFRNGKVARAIEVQKDALKLVAGNERMEKEFKARLAEFAKAAEQQ